MSTNRSRSRRKIIRIQRTHFNLGTVVFFVLLIYFVVVSLIYLQKDPITICEVTEKKMSDDNSMLGFALREEKLYQTSSSGSIAYYTGKGQKVGKNCPLFTVDAVGSFSEYVSNVKVSDKTSVRDVDNVRDIISNYRNNYNSSEYYDVYDFKYMLESSMLSSVSDAIITEFQNNNAVDSGSFSIVNSNESGIVSYWFDGYENVTKETINASYFDINDSYKKVNLKTTDTVSSGDNVCKIATSGTWNIIVKLDEKQYKKMEEKDRVGLRFCEDNLETTARYELFTVDSDYFACLTLSNFLERYIDERYIKLELYLNSVEGLKIPRSSQIEKNCYKIPVRFLTKNQDGKDILNYRYVSPDGKEEIVSLSSFCMKDKEYVYIDSDVVLPGTVFIDSSPDSEYDNKEYIVGEMKTFTGVYNVNKGYCQFKRIEVLYENQEYCIVSKDTEYGLSVYDHIVINPDSINENDIIY